MVSDPCEEALPLFVWIIFGYVKVVSLCEVFRGSYGGPFGYISFPSCLDVKNVEEEGQA
jgi:hypothetical protein